MKNAKKVNIEGGKKLRKIGWKEAYRKDSPIKIAAPLLGIVMIVLGIIFSEIWIILPGILFLLLLPWRILDATKILLECECQALIHRRDKYCSHCGRKNDYENDQL